MVVQENGLLLYGLWLSMCRENRIVAMPAMGCHASEEKDEENTRRTDISDQKL